MLAVLLFEESLKKRLETERTNNGTVNFLFNVIKVLAC